jgi:hypothetical protein
MATEVLAIGTGATSSADVTLASGAQMTVALKDVAGPEVFGGRVKVQLKADNNEYFDVDELTAPGRHALVIIGAGTYRFTRILESPSCGVFRD